MIGVDVVGVVVVGGVGVGVGIRGRGGVGVGGLWEIEYILNYKINHLLARFRWRGVLGVPGEHRQPS